MTAPRPNFLDLDPEHRNYDTARFAVLPIPYDEMTSYRPGARHAPAAIIEASAHLEDFDEELLDEYHEACIATLDPVGPNPAGPEATQADILKSAKRVIDDGKFLLTLGGDHSVTFPLVDAAMSGGKDLCVLQIDAHADLRDVYQGNRLSHACVMRRVIERGASVVPVGIRSVAKEEDDYMEGMGIDPVTARECRDDLAWLDVVVSRLSDQVYVTVDIDGFDPAFAPGTGTPEPGGLDWYQVTGLLCRVAMEKNIVAADIVEVMPIPGQVVTEYLAAKLAYKIIAYVQAGA